MTEPFDDLIRSARPQVTPDVRGRVLAHASAPSGHRVGYYLLRVAAVVALAFISGVVTARILEPDQGDNFAAMSASVEVLLERSTALNSGDELAELNSQLTAVERQRQERLTNAVAESVERILNERKSKEREIWRKKHVTHVQKRLAKKTNVIIAGYGKSRRLSHSQEAQLKRLLQAQSEQIETLVSGAYLNDFDKHELRAQLESLSEHTSARVSSLLKVKPQTPVEVLSADPADWAPSSNFRDASDAEALSYWITICDKE
ncbi:MAG: hypothetical protein ACYTDT_11245 [Planctomycetota bacterium]|jgi:hypothetical protein